MCELDLQSGPHDCPQDYSYFRHLRKSTFHIWCRIRPWREDDGCLLRTVASKSQGLSIFSTGVTFSHGGEAGSRCS